MKTDNHSEQQAIAQLESIKEMIAALNCDYERLEELKEQRADLQSEASDDTNVEREAAREALAKAIAEEGYAVAA